MDDNRTNVEIQSVDIIVEKCHWSDRLWFMSVVGTKQIYKLYVDKAVIMHFLSITTDELESLSTGGMIERKIDNLLFETITRRWTK